MDVRKEYLEMYWTEKRDEAKRFIKRTKILRNGATVAYALLVLLSIFILSSNLVGLFPLALNIGLGIWVWVSLTKTLTSLEEVLVEAENELELVQALV